jgi:hypothetical protein
MSMPTRYPNGLTNVAESDPMGSLLGPSPAKMHEYFNDFDTYVAAEWTVTETQAGATQALTAGDGGLLLLTNSAADNDLVLLQSSVANFSVTAGKRMWFDVRFQVSEATQVDWIVGLVIVDTTPLDATDGIFFQKDDGDTQIDVYCAKDASNRVSATNIATFAAATYTRLSWYFDGVDKVTYFVDGVQKGSLSVSSSTWPDANLAVTMAVQNGDGNARTMTIDYVYCAKERG